MTKEDYIEKIADCILEQWNAEDVGEDGSSARKWAKVYAERASEEHGGTVKNWLAQAQIRAADLY